METLDQTSSLIRIEYARACLHYTFESNRNEERRIHIVLILTVAALSANKYLMDSIVGLTDILRIPLHGAVIISSVVLLACLVYGIYSLTSRVFTADSQMLPEWVASVDQVKYVNQCTSQSAEESLRRIFIENHALAQAKNRRSRMHARLSWLFLLGALPTIGAFAVQLLFGLAS